MTTEKTYDVVVATDCRFPGGNTSSVVEEIRAQHRAGYRTGLLHLPSPTLDRPRPFAPKIRGVLDRGEAELVLSSDRVSARLLLARHPSIFNELPRDLPDLKVEQVVLAVNNAAVDARRSTPFYDVYHVQQQIKELTGRSATWAPISPHIREELTEIGRGVPLLPDDWENVIDLDEWRVQRTGFVSNRPVIGRHSRGHWSKWPDRKRPLLAAYPDDSGYEVRVLGGVESPVRTLGRLPDNWVSYPFNSMSPRDFLAGIDFLVYFHHPGLVEAFGRVVLEGLATGAVAIVPPAMKPLFGDVCLYGEPRDVREYIDTLYQDWDAYYARSQAGVELVRERFSHQAHVERIAKLIGPAATPAPLPPATSRTRGTLVVDLASDEHGGALMSSVVRATVAQEGPRAALVPARRAGELAARVAVETLPRVMDELDQDAQRRYLRLRLSGAIAAHQPDDVVVLDDGDSDVRDLLSTVDMDSADVWLVQPDGQSDSRHDGLIAEIAGVLPPEWGINRVEPAADSSAPAAATAAEEHDRSSRFRRWFRRVTGDLASTIRRRLAVWLRSASREGRLMLVEMDEAEIALPVPVGSTHPEPELLPVSLIVITDPYADPEPSVRSIVQRQLVTGTFRAALLAPVEWEPYASAAGLTCETLITEDIWAASHGTGWPAYVRRRIDEACRAIGPVTVVFAPHTIGDSPDGDVVLDALESARLRRRLGGEAL